MALWVLSTLEWLAGQWFQALGYAEAAQELTEKTQYAHGGAWAGRAKALVEVDLGLVGQARASAEGALALSKAASNELYTVLSLGTLGRLELALGNMEAAGRGTRRAQTDQRPAGSFRGADRDRATCCRAGRTGPHEQGDRHGAVHGRQHGGDAPLARLQQAGRTTRRARRAARADRRDCRSVSTTGQGS